MIRPVQRDVRCVQAKSEPRPEEGRRKKKKKLVPSRPAASAQAKEEKEGAEPDILSARSDVSASSKVGSGACMGSARFPGSFFGAFKSL